MSFSTPPTSSAPPTQDIATSEQVTVKPSATIPTRPLKDKAPIQETNTDSKELKSFSPEHENLVMKVSEPSYTPKAFSIDSCPER